MFKVKKFKKTEKLRKPTKTISGVTPIAVVLKPQKCKHGTCLYCPSLKVPQSYTLKSPAIMRAAALNYDSYEQTKARLKSFKVMNHPVDKIEIIVMGGTFPDYDEKCKEDAKNSNELLKIIKKCVDEIFKIDFIKEKIE